MKNLLLLASLFVLPSLSNACMYEVSQQVRSLENSLDDANTLLRSIDNVVAQNRLDYCDAGYAMINLLRTLGSSETANINLLFTTLAPVAPQTNERLVDMTQNFTSQVIQLENGTGDDLQHANLLANLVMQRQVMSSREFLDADGNLLRSFGSSETATVLQVLSTLASYHGIQYEPLNQLVQSVLTVKNFENGTGDVLQHLNTGIGLARQYNRSLTEILNTSSELVRNLGSDKTSDVLNLTGILAEISARANVYLPYMVADVIRLNSLENGIGDVVSGVSLVREAVLRGASQPAQAFQLLNRLTQDMGSSNTAQIQAEFRRMMRM